jgi:hypothetical protein
MGERRSVDRIFVERPERKNHLEYPDIDGRLMLMWIFRMRDVEDMDWIDLAKDRDRWRVLVNAVMNLRVP